MNKTLRVVWYELVRTLTRVSFLAATFGLPLISWLGFGSLYALDRTESQAAISQVIELAAEFSGAETDTANIASEGYIDQSGIIKVLPSHLPDDLLTPYPSEESARQALEQGEITAYYVITPEYLETGRIIYVRLEFDPFSAFTEGSRMQDVLRLNLLEGDEQLTSLVAAPLDLQIVILEPGTQRDETNPLTLMLPYLSGILFLSSMITSTSLFLRSLSDELENRTLEILLTTVSARQILTGKIIALGITGLLQTCTWLGTGYAILAIRGQSSSISDIYQVNPVILVWGMIFFLLGYTLYASITAAIGAMVPDLRDASIVNYLLMYPLMAPVLLFLIFAREPNGGLATALSLFPLTAPTAALSRLAASNEVPIWQLFLSAGILTLTIWLTIRSAARLFRAHNLLAGESFSFRRLWVTLMEKGE
ncbi:MAG: ABC transporter permease [Anaerolineales bacterium]|nr:ABC transporter permease [Anaerolineales bacterium]